MNQKNHLPFISILALFAAIVFLPLSLAAAAETADIEAVSCDCDAYVADTDPAGLNVRSGPGTENPVIGTLPTNRPVEVHISKSAGEWMRIIEYTVFDDTTKGSTMNINGWVYGPLLAVTTRIGTYKGYDPEGLVEIYDSPYNNAVLIARPPKDTVVRIAGCKGTWIKVKNKGLEEWFCSDFYTEGWLDPSCYCGNPVEKCP